MFVIIQFNKTIYSKSIGGIYTFDFGKTNGTAIFSKPIYSGFALHSALHQACTAQSCHIFSLRLLSFHLSWHVHAAPIFQRMEIQRVMKSCAQQAPTPSPTRPRALHASQRVRVLRPECVLRLPINAATTRQSLHPIRSLAGPDTTALREPRPTPRSRQLSARAATTAAPEPALLCLVLAGTSARRGRPLPSPASRPTTSRTIGPPARRSAPSGTSAVGRPSATQPCASTGRT